MGINLRVRNLENNLKSILNEYSDVPIEMKRIVVNGILEQITAQADLVTKQEMAEYLKEQQKEQEVANVWNRLW